MAIQLRTEIAVPLLKFWEHGMLNMKSIVYPEIGLVTKKWSTIIIHINGKLDVQYSKHWICPQYIESLKLEYG